MLLIFRIPKMEFKLKTKSNLLNKQVSHLKNLSILNPFEIFCWVKRNKAYTQLLYIFLLSQKNKVLSCFIFLLSQKEQSVHSVVVYFLLSQKNKVYTQLLYIFAESKGTKRTLSCYIFLLSQKEQSVHSVVVYFFLDSPLKKPSVCIYETQFQNLKNVL